MGFVPLTCSMAKSYGRRSQRCTRWKPDQRWRVGVCFVPESDGSGCSPDRLVNTDGLLQIKCPQTKNHIAALLGKDIAPDYIKQMQWEMRCTERQWCDFVSYDPRLPVEMQLHTVRVKRDGGMIEKMEAAVIEFLSELDETVAKLRGLYALGAAA
ncbi:MAG: YqaJ viral recombinase family protein [Proteobacteria bacterium]|nr:YqaJ viral recombinase family protein [Pseudomonadota bacterium]